MDNVDKEIYHEPICHVIIIPTFSFFRSTFLNMIWMFHNYILQDVQVFMQTSILPRRALTDHGPQTKKASAVVLEGDRFPTDMCHPEGSRHFRALPKLMTSLLENVLEPSRKFPIRDDVTVHREKRGERWKSISKTEKPSKVLCAETSEL
jgi:hypothetical protein